jgi:hypothetical protein
MNLTRFLAMLLTVALFATVANTSASGQAIRPKWKDCVDSISDRDLRPVAVFIASDADDSTPAVLKSADFLIDTLAARMRVALGAPAGHLSVGEPRITRRNIDGSVHVTLHSTGDYSWLVARDSATDTTQLRGVQLIAGALQELKSDGKRIPWPDNAKGDSATFRIFFVAPHPAKDGTAGSIEVRYAAPVVALSVPWSEPVVVTKVAHPHYPDAPRRGSAQSTTLLQFLVDENGNVDKSSIHVVRDPRVPPYTGYLADYYRLFVKAATESVENTEYRPETMGGCRVPRVVRQPFEFILR